MVITSLNYIERTTMKKFIFIFLITGLCAQAERVNDSSMWGVYAGYQSMQISGIEDDASDEELEVI